MSKIIKISLDRQVSFPSQNGGLDEIFNNKVFKLVVDIMASINRLPARKRFYALRYIKCLLDQFGREG